MGMPVSITNWTSDPDGNWYPPGVQMTVPDGGGDLSDNVAARGLAALAAVEKLAAVAAGLLDEAGL
jgi:hypothetical protein